MAALRDAAARADAYPGSILVVVHDFKARSADELSLSKGDRIELIERDDDFNDGWFLGRHLLSGTSGLFPEVYTTLAPPKSAFNTTTAPRRTSGTMPHAVQAQESSSKPTTGATTTTVTATMQRPASISTISTMPQRPTSDTSSLSKPSTTTTRSSLPNTMESKPLNLSNTQSPVMHETLTVIDEHMNDMNPGAMRNNSGNSSNGRRDTISSMYSSYPNRMSYIAGHETEDEEGQMYTEAEVMRWTSGQVAEYLEDHGVEKSHCKVFKEQDITGEVLLAMDQSSIFLKEFDLGAVGRRLRTWHKIKALQDETQRNTTAGAANLTPPSFVYELEANDTTRLRSTSASAISPLRSSMTQSQSQTPSTPTLSRDSIGTSPLLTTSLDTSYRPSAQNIRTMQHWRHSSVDSTTAPSFDASLQSGNRRRLSTDQRLHANGTSANHSRQASAETSPYLNKEGGFAPQTAAGSPGDLDKGYFSSTEAESRARRASVLQKRAIASTAGSSHSRNSSYVSYTRRSNPAAAAARAASTDSLLDPMISPIISPNLHSGTFSKTMSGLRTISMPTYGSKTMTSVNESATPMITKLQPSSSPFSGTTANASPLPGASGLSSEATTPSVSIKHLPFFSKTSKIPGMRAISDAVTRQEKSTVKDGEVASPTKDGMSTPSTGQTSFDLKSGKRTSVGSASGIVPQPTPKRAKPKTKKSTSAYTRGLEKKNPAEQMADCDYSGWMKKKSGSLMTTWKPRLFVLRGRRLSYYYDENDTEEKGLIDISFHNVMPAMDEKLISMHAAMTGAGNASSGSADTLTTTAQQELKDNPPKPGTDDDGLFIFKLTPPKAGRGVNFTKPTVHYFAVNSRQEGRLWMAALMKAVIDRDQDGVVTTTYNQQTISLAKARARRERPPALKDEEITTPPAIRFDGSDMSDGLGIEGLRINGAPARRSYVTEDSSSIAASSIPTAAPSITIDLGDNEKSS